MTIAIDKVRTGQQIRLLMEKRGVTVRDVKNALSLACVQSVYHWLDGQSMPTLRCRWICWSTETGVMIPTRIFRKVRSASSGTTGSYRNAWQPESVRTIQKDLSPARRRSAVSRVLLLEECLCQEEEVKNDAADDFRKGIL